MVIYKGMKMLKNYLSMNGLIENGDFFLRFDNIDHWIHNVVNDDLNNCIEVDDVIINLAQGFEL